VPDYSAIKKEKVEFVKSETILLAIREENQVDTFISGLRQYQSHFLIAEPSKMEEAKILLTFKRGDIVLIQQIHKLKIQSKWYPNPYIVYWAHNNNT
jgi:hypothetical protein